MKIYKVVITKSAEADLIGVVKYVAIELREPLTAQNLLDRISEAIFDLEQMPYRNPLVRDDRLASQGFRMQLIDNYHIFYIISEMSDSVRITRILYGKRDWSSLI